MTDFIAILSTKVASMMGGFFGGAAILTFIKPKTISEAFLRGSLSTGSAMVFAHPLAMMAKLDDNWESQLMSGFCVGFLAYSILGMVANFLKKNQDKDIVETIKEIKK
jgi:hypothetical protein